MMEFNDETRWFGFVPTRTFVTLIITAVLTIGAFNVLGGLFGTVIGVILAVIVALVGIFIALSSIIPVVGKDYMDGGCLTLDKYMLRKRYRKRKKIVYMKMNK